jgi:hypothetical protein
MQIPSISLSQHQLESARPEDLLRLAKYMKMKAFYHLGHEELAFIVSLVLADQFLNACDPHISGL